MEPTKKQLELIKNDDYKTLKGIVENNKSVNKELLLLNAIKYQSVKTIKMLIDVGTDYYAINEEILYAAVSEKNIKIVALILRKRHYSYTIMHEAMDIALKLGALDIHSLLYKKYYS